MDNIFTALLSGQTGFDEWPEREKVDFKKYVEHLEAKIEQLGEEKKQLKEAIEEAKVKRGQYREIIEALLVPTNFIGIEAARDYILETLEGYGLIEPT